MMCRLLMRALLRCARWGLFLPLLCLLVLLPAATSSASETPEPMYQITESELRTLETNLAQLRSANERLQVDLRAQSSEATALRKEVTALRKELSDLKQQSMMQENSLTNANKLLEEYAIEAKRERLRIKAQRNTWVAAAGILAAGLALK